MTLQLIKKKYAEDESLKKLLNKTYGGGVNMLLQRQGINKTFQSTTEGIINDIYGAEVYNQLNQNTNTFSYLPKKAYTKNGHRIRSTRSVSDVNLGDPGIAELGDFTPELDAVYVEVTTGLKLIFQGRYSISLIKELRESGNDDVAVPQIIKDAQEDFVKSMNRMILRDTTTPAVNNFESIDRITASSELEGTGTIVAGDVDIYGIDRSANLWANAVVNHNSGTDRALTLGILNSVLDGIYTNQGSQPDLIITGVDTGTDIDNLLSSDRRFVSSPAFQVAGDGFSTGVEGGFIASSYRSIPILRDPDVVKDTKSRIYFLSLKNVYIEFALPPTHITTADFGYNSFFYQGTVGRAQTEGGFIAAGQLTATRLNNQGSGRDFL